MNRNPRNNFETLTPTKFRRTITQPSATSPTKKQEGRLQQSSTVNQPPVIRVRDKLFVLPQIQEILQKLNFNTFQPFPFEEIELGRNRLNGIYATMKNRENPSCLNHAERLNLYCEKDRELVCVDCVYKDNKHKGHSIIPLDRIIKSLQFEVIRTQDKVQQVIDTLMEWEKRVAQSVSDLSDVYLSISNTIGTVFKTMINEIQRVETECSKIILQNFKRTSNIMKNYGDAIEKARGVFHSQLRFVNDLEEVNKIGFLREVSHEVVVCERLVKKTGETLSSLQTWKDIQVHLERLNDKKKKEDQTIRERDIIVTEF